MFCKFEEPGFNGCKRNLNISLNLLHIKWLTQFNRESQITTWSQCLKDILTQVVPSLPEFIVLVWDLCPVSCAFTQGINTASLQGPSGQHSRAARLPQLGTRCFLTPSTSDQARVAFTVNSELGKKLTAGLGYTGVEHAGCDNFTRGSPHQWKTLMKNWWGKKQRETEGSKQLRKDVLNRDKCPLQPKSRVRLSEALPGDPHGTWLQMFIRMDTAHTQGPPAQLILQVHLAAWDGADTKEQQQGAPCTQGGDTNQDFILRLLCCINSLKIKMVLIK